MRLARYLRSLPIIPVTIIAIFMLLAVVADFALIYYSGNYYNGMVTDNSYQKGLEYNRTIEAARAQEISGIYDTIQWSDQHNQLEFCLYDRNDAIKSARLVVIRLRHPITDRYDQTIELVKPANSGCYKANIKLSAGRWELMIHAYVPRSPEPELDYYRHTLIKVDD